MSSTYSSTIDQLGRPLRDLRLSIIDACNFRCRYCMPADKFPAGYQFLTARERLSVDEIERLGRIFIRAGVRKIRLTGGEPLLHRDVIEIVRRLATLSDLQDLAMITNGFRLERHAEALKEAGLQRLTVSLDALDDKVQARISPKDVDVKHVLQGISAAKSAGFTGTKINCVVIKGVNDNQIIPLTEWALGEGHILRFIEYMDVGTSNGWRKDEVFGREQILERLATRWAIEPLHARYHGEVATRFRCGSGEIGIINSVTQPFCGSCTRARLSARGELYPCLFSKKGTDLLTPLREHASDEDLLALITGFWNPRNDRYSELRHTFDSPQDKVDMHHIGG